MPSVTLHPATGEFDYVKSLLATNDLPTTDLGESPASIYYATADGERVGIGGIEEYREAGLLRSVVVEGSKRGCGYGSAICQSLEGKARETGIERLYLLTTTAPAFFAAQGYSTIDRTTAPDAIRGTTEFEDLCPQTATCMRKSLA
ncbi:MAG: arsenic resistance N-acetyltransferase ArsN2 [Haloarculaceae archaeon]